MRRYTVAKTEREREIARDLGLTDVRIHGDSGSGMRDDTDLVIFCIRESEAVELARYDLTPEDGYEQGRLT